VCHDGDLVEGGRATRRAYTWEEKREWQGMLAYIAQERGYQRGWIAHKFKEKFGLWPTHSSAPIEPSREVRARVRSRQIAFAKGREKAASNG
jgi:DNA repair protein RadD